MPVNLALCIEWAHGWDCRLKLSVFVDYRKLLLLQKCSRSAAYPTCWLLWRRGYWGSWRQAWVGCGRYGDRPLEIGLVVASGKLSAYFQKRYSSLSSVQPMRRSSVLKVTEPVIVYVTYQLVGTYTFSELKLQNAVKGSRVIITLLIWNKTPFFMECYVGHFPLFEIYVVDTTF